MDSAVALTRVSTHKNLAVRQIVETMSTALHYTKSGTRSQHVSIKTWHKRSRNIREYRERKARIVCEQHFDSLNRLMNPVKKCCWNASFVSLFLFIFVRKFLVNLRTVYTCHEQLARLLWTLSRGKCVKSKVLLSERGRSAKELKGDYWSRSRRLRHIAPSPTFNSVTIFSNGVSMRGLVSITWKTGRNEQDEKLDSALSRDRRQPPRTKNFFKFSNCTLGSKNIKLKQVAHQMLVITALISMIT